MIWHKIFRARCLPQAEFCGVLWCVCFFSLLMSARAAHLFLWGASQGKPCKINLGAFLKGPNMSWSWGKALNLCQRCDFLLETCFSWKTCWELGEPCAPTSLLEYDPQCNHPLSVPSAPNQNHPAVCLLPKQPADPPAPVRKTAGNKKMWCISATFLPFVHGSSLSCSP